MFDPEQPPAPSASMDDNANEQAAAAAAEEEQQQEAASHNMDRDQQEQEQEQRRRPPPPRPFLRSAHPSFFPQPSPRQSPPRPASPSALQPIAEVNARRTAQLLRDAARDQELERARRAPLLVEGASQSSSSPEASPASFSSPHAAGAGKRKSDHSGTTTVEDQFAAATRRLLQTPSLGPFADGGETPFSVMSMHQRGGVDEEEEGEQRDPVEGAPRMSLPPNDGQGEWDQEEDATHPQHPQQQQQHQHQHQQQLSPRTRLRKWRAAVGASQQQQHHIASHFFEGADARLARAAARRGSTGGGAAIGGGEAGHGDDVWDGRGIVQGAGEKESVEEFGEAA